MYYNGQLYEGTGRLPRDAPFTPSYINTYTVNSAIAFVSLVVTITFFYFKIVVGLLESPQVGPDREFLVSMAMDHHGPIDGSEPRPILEPICPSSEELLDQQRQRNGRDGQGGVGSDDCVLFGKIVVLADSISKYGYTHATHGWLGFLADEWAGRADVVLRGFPGTVPKMVLLFSLVLSRLSRLSWHGSLKSKMKLTPLHKTMSNDA